MAELEVSLADGTKRRHPLAAGPVSIGRAAECDLVLEEQKASRRHCRVEPRDKGWRVVDEGSANGTFLEGQPVISARLAPGDQIEIGDTAIAFVDESAPAPAPREPRRPRVRRRQTPWGVLALPVVALGIALGVVIKFGRSDGADSADAMRRYAAAEIERASLAGDVAGRDAILSAASAVAGERLHGGEAVELLTAAARGPIDTAPAAGTDAPRAAPSWRSALDAFDADTAATPSQRRARLAELLERHGDVAPAVAELGARLRAEIARAAERMRTDRTTTFAAAEQATADGRLGDALAAWRGWIARAPQISAEDEAGVASRLDELILAARTAAETAASKFDTLRAAGRNDAAQSEIDAAIDRLRGTGFDVWLAARDGNGVRRAPTKSGPTAADDPAAIERARALQLLGAGEKLVRERKFGDAVRKIEEAAAAVTDTALRGEIALRAGDVKSESAFLTKLLGLVAADPAKFTQLKLGDRLVRVVAATPEFVTVGSGTGAPVVHPVATLPSVLVAQFAEKAGLGKEDYIAAALLLNDLDEKDAFLRWMRAAMPDDDAGLREAASIVYARVMGKALPTGGYWPHPRDGRTVVTADEKRAIENAEKIRELGAELAKLVDKIEKSKQAKQVEAVRRAYAKLETARKSALALIFDEVRYFYPYRDRMKEYSPVQAEVDDLVKAVRDAWDDPASAKVRTDGSLEDARAKADKLVTEIQYYQGDPSAFTSRIEAVTMYLGHDITVRTFYESQLDLDRYAYNERVMKWNLTVKGPTENERRQVEVTNEYRIMFGHRACVRVHPQLVESARGHSTDMSNLGFFDHESPIPEKKTFDMRIKLAGYEPAGCSENIEEGRGDPEAAHAGWCHSSGHHRNLLSASWRELGSGQCGSFWTQNFGFRVDDGWEGGSWK